MSGLPPRLILFTKYPRPAHTKTRLIPLLGETGAALLHDRLARRTVEEYRKAGGKIEVRYDGADTDTVGDWLGCDLMRNPQGPGDIGERMHRALSEALETGAPCAVLTGTDIPGLDAQVLRDAVNLLENHDVVLGPATDGGYYLVGIKQVCPELFRDIPWSTADTFDATMRRADELGLRVGLLSSLSDCDTPEAFREWRRRAEDQSGGRLISVIIPTLDEADGLTTALACAADSGVEWIVADGGSSDDTIDRAEACGARVVVSPAGRGGQMDAGASAARGEFLLFLHADTLLPLAWAPSVRTVLGETEVAIGAFGFGVLAQGRKYRRLERWINARCCWFGLPYGDQALFLRRSVFEDLGGFRGLPILEDVDLVRRAKGVGRFEMLAPVAITSARRWEHRGVVSTTVKNALMMLGYRLGVSPERLYRWYYGKQVPK